MANEGLITEEEAIARVDPAALDQLLHTTLDPAAQRDVIAKGLPASPGAASGVVVFDADHAEKRAAAGEAVILVRGETSPEDMPGMHAARSEDGRVGQVSVSTSRYRLQQAPHKQKLYTTQP